MEKRIKEVRSNAGLTQAAFAERLGLKKSTVEKLEYGTGAYTERTIRAICDQFGVNRLWLETGQKPMYLPEAEDDAIIDEVLSGENEFVKALFRGIAKTPGGWEAMERVFTAVQRELDAKKEPEESSSGSSGH